MDQEKSGSGRDAGTPAPGLGDVLRLLFREGTTPWPRWVDNPHPLRLPEGLPAGRVAATFVNHASFLLQSRGLNLLFDPIFSPRASPVSWAGPKRVKAPSPSFEQLPDIGLVLVTHNHYDHMDLPSLARLRRRFDPLFVTGRGNAATLAKAGLTKVLELEWWQEAGAAALGRAGGGARVTYTPARHFSARGLRDRGWALWGGFHLELEGLRVFFAGDTAYGPHFAEISSRLGAPDLALLPIGAYAPRWFFRAFHCDPEDAARAHLDLRARLSLAMHFGTFKLTKEAYDQPVRELGEALSKKGIPPSGFRVLEHGQTVLVEAA